MEYKSNFIFQGHTWDSSTGIATFSYKIEHKEEIFAFTEQLTFPQPIAGEYADELVQRCLDALLLVLGVSYYKLYCPKTIILESIKLNKEQAAFWETVYRKGLGEFFYTNKIDSRGLISFPVATDEAVSPIQIERQNRSLLGIGGGKDSLVAGELLKKHNKAFTAFVINDHPIRSQTIDTLGAARMIVKRELDPLLLTLNKREDTLNGHVPVSAQNAFIGYLTAVLYDYNAIIVGNEHTASYGNAEYLGEEVNHQWSKSIEFEKMFQKYTAAYLTKEITYFSLLRPFTEIAIAKMFTAYPKYYNVFSSCNKNFRITGGGNDSLWCGECAKCAFIFSLLAAFIPKEQLLAIFGKNLYDDASLLQIYKELLGVASIKPFDCVGTPEEVKVAFLFAMQSKAYDNSPVMKYFIHEILPTIDNSQQLEKDAFQLAAHRIPEAFQEVITV